jgi:hypothetical protein
MRAAARWGNLPYTQYSFIDLLDPENTLVLSTRAELNSDLSAVGNILIFVGGNDLNPDQPYLHWAGGAGAMTEKPRQPHASKPHRIPPHHRPAVAGQRLRLPAWRSRRIHPRLPPPSASPTSKPSNPPP